MHRWLLCSLLLLLVGCAVTPKITTEGNLPAQPKAPPTQVQVHKVLPIPVSNISGEMMSPAPGKIIALGDSLTAGFGVPAHGSYPAQLERMLKENGFNYTVINAGKSGDTAVGVRGRLDPIIEQQPDIVILEIGINDALSGSTAASIEGNISEIVEQLQEHKIKVIIAGAGDLSPFGLGNFSNIYVQIARKYDVPLIPLFLQGVAGIAEFNLPDRVHPNEKGYKIIAQNVYPYVEEAIKEKIEKNNSTG